MKKVNKKYILDNKYFSGIEVEESDNLDDYTKTIIVKDRDGNDRNHKIFDMEKIWLDKSFVFLLMTERGTWAKTTQQKFLAKKLWDDDKLRWMWCMNTIPLIRKEFQNIFEKPKKLFDSFSYANKGNEDDYKNSGTYTILDSSKDKNNWFIKYVPISGAENEKGSRLDYAGITLDEFNVGDKFVKYEQARLVGSLIATAMDTINKGDDLFRKLIINGNTKSLNHPYMVELGLTEINSQVLTLSYKGVIFMRVLRPIYNNLVIQEKEKELEKDPRYLFLKASGQSDHIIFNKELDDDASHNVNKLYLTLPKQTIQVLKCNKGKSYIEINVIDTKQYGRVIYFIDISNMKEKIDVYKKSTIVVAWKKDSLAEKVSLNTLHMRDIIEQLAIDKIWFNTKLCRSLILGEIV